MDRAERAFERRSEREPRNAYAPMELGADRPERDDRAEATALLGRVTQLYPRDDTPARRCGTCKRAVT